MILVIVGKPFVLIDSRIPRDKTRRERVVSKSSNDARESSIRRVSPPHTRLPNHDVRKKHYTTADEIKKMEKIGFQLHLLAFTVSSRLRPTEDPR